MKKSRLVLSCLLLGLTMCGCNKKSVDTYADISNSTEIISSNKGASFTAGDIYKYIRENGDLNISRNILLSIMKDQLDFTNEDISNLYKKYLNEYFKTTFVDSGSYNYNGEFSEDLLIKYLKSESYNIKCGENYNSGLLDSNYFTCDYSDYIEKEVNYNIYLKMLKIEYIINEKSSLIDKNEARRINYYSISRSSSTDYETRENLESLIRELVENQTSEEDVIKNLEDIAELKRKEDLDTIETEFGKVAVDDTSFSMLNKYTTCGDKKCTLEEGKKYQQDIIINKDYYTSKIVVKSNTSVLYEAARNILFSKDLSNYLYTIGDEKYLVSPAYGTLGEQSVNDIILFDNSSTYYLVTVQEINSESNFNDQVLVAELLLETISDSDVLSYYIDKSELKIYDKQIREYFVSKYGDYERDN